MLFWHYEGFHILNFTPFTLKWLQHQALTTIGKSKMIPSKTLKLCAGHHNKSFYNLISQFYRKLCVCIWVSTRSIKWQSTKYLIYYTCAKFSRIETAEEKFPSNFVGQGYRKRKLNSINYIQQSTKVIYLKQGKSFCLGAPKESLIYFNKNQWQSPNFPLDKICFWWNIEKNNKKRNIYNKTPTFPYHRKNI